MAATLPRPSKLNRYADITARPVSDFDAGLNTSAAWTEHLDSASLSDDEHIHPDDNNLDEPPRPARALYPFEGKPEFRELTVQAGDDLEVIKEVLPDGWSLVQTTADGEVGLLPRTYYIFTSEFVSAPENSPSHKRRDAEASSSSITPRASPSGGDKNTPLPIIPQNTGEWRGPFPNFRQSLLGGKSLNRFSSFVTSGAEAWVLNGATEDTNADATSSITPAAGQPEGHQRMTSEDADEEDSNRLSRLGKGEADRHFVDTGPSWKSKIPPFRILVHSPSKRSSVLSGAYTIYNITSFFSPEDPYEVPNKHSRIHSDFNVIDSSDATPTPLPRLTVQRRFSHFVLLHTALTRRLPGIALPPLPEKQYSGRFNDDFVEARRGDLERYINKIVRHPVARYAEFVTFFLSCESEIEWTKHLPHHLSLPPAGPTFYAKVYHPAFNIDVEDAEHSGHAFSTHTKAVSKGVQGLRSIFGKVREARLEMAKAERGLGYAILGMITSSASSPNVVAEEDEEESESGGSIGKVTSGGVVNSDGAWCWREGCKECLKLTKGLQKLSETSQSVADLYDDHARRTQLATHESLKIMAHPDAIYEPIITTHKSALSRYKGVLYSANDTENAELGARCETVLNTTMAEMDIYHTQKVEDFERLAREHLDGEIRLYELILTRLRTARQNLTPPTYDDLANSPRSTSLYERELFPASPSITYSGFTGAHLSNSTTHKFIPSQPNLRNPNASASAHINANGHGHAIGNGIGEILVPPLPQPHPHVFDSAPMRPVSAAVQGGVGMVMGVAQGATGVGLRLLGAGGGGGGSSRILGGQVQGQESEGVRGSVFGRLWS